uniref:Uncharacterized protein n=1 Tax=Tanacetum cinerariifolium TaxID=118510 RepID=A0A699JXI5_TANCI|nr:hypothetical protein [Tanacetum cinerariifolium]
MDTRKNIVDLEAFREILHISPRIPGQSFAELPFEEEILEFLRFLRHSAQIKTLTDVNVNKLFQPWRSFAAVTNKCLTEKVSASTVSGSVRLVALAGCFPLAAAVSLGAAIVMIGLGDATAVGGVVDESEPPFFFLALAFGFGDASQVAQA